MKTPPVRQGLERLRMRGSWYPSIAELLESDGNTYLADVRASYARIGTLSRNAGTTWTIVTLDNHVVNPHEAAQLAGELERAGATVRFRDVRGVFADVHGHDGGNAGVLPAGRLAHGGNNAVREIYTRSPHGFHLPLSSVREAVASKRDIEATMREFIWRELGGPGREGAGAPQRDTTNLTIASAGSTSGAPVAARMSACTRTGASDPSPLSCRPDSMTAATFRRWPSTRSWQG